MKPIFALSGVALVTLGAYFEFGPYALMAVGIFLVAEAKFIK